MFGELGNLEQRLLVSWLKALWFSSSTKSIHQEMYLTSWLRDAMVLCATQDNADHALKVDAMSDRNEYRIHAILCPKCDSDDLLPVEKW